MLQRQGSARRLHTAAAADPTPPVYDYGVHSRVMTCDGHPGTVLAVAEGPFPGAESYDVRLDGGLGGGAYLAGQLQPLAAGHTTGTAAADYPELAQVLVEHPDPARGTLARAAALQITAMPSRNHPDPEGFQVREYPPPSVYGERAASACNGRDCHGFEERELRGYDPAHAMHPQPVSTLRYRLSGCGHQVKVDGLYTAMAAEHHGYASALMDHLYARHPHARIDHGTRSPEGQSWWSTYDDPDPSRSISDDAFSAHTAAAEMSLGETIVPNRIPGPGPTKARSPMDNPASSGWASGSDPDQWSAAPLYPLDSRVGQTLTADGAEATLHDEPEAALPTTDGQVNADDADPEALNPMGFNAVLQDFWAKAAHLDPRRSGATRADGDIAAAAQAHLAGLGKTAAYAFTPGQRRELIEEAPEALAANSDRLDLTGTHYADMQQMMGDDEEDDGSWLV